VTEKAPESTFPCQVLPEETIDRFMGRQPIALYTDPPSGLQPAAARRAWTIYVT
jgi:hypothetical protein